MEGKLRKLVDVLVISMLLLVSLCATINYRLASSGYSHLWSQVHPIKSTDDRLYDPVMLLSVSEADSKVTVRLFRTYAAPSLLDLMIVTTLYLRDGAVNVFSAKVRIPLGVVQEFTFHGSSVEVPICTSVKIYMDGEEVVRWSSCDRS